MRNKILRRIVIVMSLTMFIITAAIVGSFAIVSLNDTETEVKEFAEAISDQVSRAESLMRLDMLISNKQGSSIRMTVFSPSGEAIGDTHDIEQLKERNLSFDPQTEALLTADNGATLSKYATIYQNSSRMFTYYVKVQISEDVYKSGFVIVRFAKPALVGQKPFIIFVVALTIFWMVVSIALVVFYRLNVRASVEPLTTVQNIMSDIREGKYKKTEVSKYLVASQADKMLEEIDKMGATINDTMHNLNVLLESITQGVIALDKEGEIIFSNTRAVELLTIDPKKGPTKEFERQYAQEYAMFKESLKSHVPTVFENTVNGKYLHVQTIFPEEVEGLDMYMLLVATDITEQVKTAKAKQEFFANASHELKTPLTAIAGYSEILSMNKPTEKQITKCSTEIQMNAIKMKTLIDEMLQLSKMDSQTREIEKEEFSLKTLCEETIDELRVIAKKHDIEISITGDCQVYGNYKEMMMLVKNLVSNAIKYNKEKGYVKIAIKDKGDSVILSVKDNGIGIAKENQEKVFERFYRVDEARVSVGDESSTGLGLAIVKQVVQDHKGTIEIESDLGKGTEFIITMPKR
ncbi:MAG: GHKL domain-containing protein [Clostridia bacterium]|nr:GHKL domain-containing protein [Clostridia bacterium]